MNSGTITAFSNSINTIIEICDYPNLKEELFHICELVYKKINDFNNDQATQSKFTSE